MSYQQLRDPNLNIPYTGGLCLQAVREAFGIPHPVYPTAMADWQSGKGNHSEKPPVGLYAPVFFSLGNVPAGHVAISLPNGQVASSTQEGVHQGLYIHPSLDHLIATYAKANGGCTYLGWSEVVENVPVIQGDQPMTDLERNIADASDAWRSISTVEIPKNELDKVTYDMDKQGHNAAGNYHVAVSMVKDVLQRYATDEHYAQRQAVLDWMGQTPMLMANETLTKQVQAQSAQLGESANTIADLQQELETLKAQKPPVSDPTTQGDTAFISWLKKLFGWTGGGK